MPSQERYAVLFAREVAAGATGEDTFLIKDACTVEHLSVRFYQGANNELLITPMLRDPDGVPIPLVRYSSTAGVKAFVDGNDDELTFDVSFPAWRNWQLVMQYQSIAAIALDYKTRVLVDLERGADRAGLPALAGGLK